MQTNTETTEVPFPTALINLVLQLGKLPTEAIEIDIPKNAGESFALAYAATAVEGIADKDMAKVASYIEARGGFKAWRSKTKLSEKRDRLRTYLLGGLKSWDEADAFEIYTHTGAVAEMEKRLAASLPAAIETPSASSNPSAPNSAAATAERKARRKKPVAEKPAPTELSQAQRNIVQQWAKKNLAITDEQITEGHEAVRAFWTEMSEANPKSDPRLIPLIATELELCRVRIGAEIDAAAAAAKPKRRSKKDTVIDEAVATITEQHPELAKRVQREVELIPGPGLRMLPEDDEDEAIEDDAPRAVVVDGNAPVIVCEDGAPRPLSDAAAEARPERKKRARDEEIYALVEEKTIDELRAMYEEIYGRKTKANHKRVLAWRIVLGKRAIAAGDDPKASMPAPRGTPALRLTIEDVRSLLTTLAPIRTPKKPDTDAIKKLVAFSNEVEA